MRQMLSVVLALVIIAGACSSNEDTASDTPSPTESRPVVVEFEWTEQGSQVLTTVTAHGDGLVVMGRGLAVFTARPS